MFNFFPMLFDPGGYLFCTHVPDGFVKSFFGYLILAEGGRRSFCMSRIWPSMRPTFDDGKKSARTAVARTKTTKATAPELMTMDAPFGRSVTSYGRW